MNRIDYMAKANDVMMQIKKGAFLTVKADNRMNVMTIGWSTIGFVWSRPVMMVAVRPTRYTFSIIEHAQDFTVSVPYQQMQDELKFCGTKSGRDCDKFKQCGLSTAKAQKISTPIISLNGIHYECRIVATTKMEPECIDNTLESLYPNKDYHTLYYGEIVDCYETA